MLLIFFLSMYADSDISGPDVKKIVKKISPSIVKVVAQDGRRYIASGIAINKDLVVSNAKVAEHPFRRIILITQNGKSYNAAIVGKDSKSSIILLRTDKKDLNPVKSGKLPETGDWVGLAGIFYRNFPYIKSGIVSSVNKNEMILDAEVMPGTTGGAVVNKKGEFIGMIRGMIGFRSFPQYIFKDDSSELKVIPTEKSKHAQCFAIPADRVDRVAKELNKFGYVRRGWLGVRIAMDNGNFIRIDNVDKGSPAEKFGLKSGDIIRKIDGLKIKSARKLGTLISSKIPGKKLRFIVNRNGKDLKLDVKLGDLRERKSIDRVRNFFSFTNEMPIVPELIRSLPKMKNYVFNIMGPVTLGFDLVSLTPELAKEFGIRENGGLLISKIRKKKISDSGIRVGDIVVKAGRKLVRSADDLRSAIFSLKKGEKITLKYYRKGKLISSKVEPEIIKGDHKVYQNFNNRVNEIKFWAEQVEKRRLKRKIEKLQALKVRSLEEAKARELNLSLKKAKEREFQLREKIELERESKMLRKEYLKKVRKEIDKLRAEMIRVERELKKEKEKNKN